MRVSKNNMREQQRKIRKNDSEFRRTQRKWRREIRAWKSLTLNFSKQVLEYESKPIGQPPLLKEMQLRISCTKHFSALCRQFTNTRRRMREDLDNYEFQYFQAQKAVLDILEHPERASQYDDFGRKVWITDTRCVV